MTPFNYCHPSLQNHTILSLIGTAKLGKEKKEAKKRKEKKEYEPIYPQCG
jgi:hypothetical protein